MSEKRCAKFERLRDDYQSKIRMSAERAQKYIANGDSMRIAVTQSWASADRRAMARALNNHLSRCRMCA